MQLPAFKDFVIAAIILMVAVFLFRVLLWVIDKLGSAYRSKSSVMPYDWPKPMNGLYRGTSTNVAVHYKNDEVHSLSGPAVVYPEDEYFIYGKKYSKEEWEKQVLIMKMSGIKE